MISLKTPLKFSFTKWSLWWDFPALTLSSLFFRQLVVLFACRTFIKNERHLISSKMSHFTAHPQEKLWVSQGRGGCERNFWLFAVVCENRLISFTLYLLLLLLLLLPLPASAESFPNRPVPLHPATRLACAAPLATHHPPHLSPLPQPPPLGKPLLRW